MPAPVGRTVGKQEVILAIGPVGSRISWRYMRFLTLVGSQDRFSVRSR
jgi:hypothetical protein